MEFLKRKSVPSFILVLIYLFLVLSTWKWESTCGGGWVISMCQLGYSLITAPEMAVASLFTNVAYFQDLQDLVLTTPFILMSVIFNSALLYLAGLANTRKQIIRNIAIFLLIILIACTIFYFRF